MFVKGVRENFIIGSWNALERKETKDYKSYLMRNAELS